MLKRLAWMVCLSLLLLFNFAFAKVGILSTQEVASMIGKKGVVIIDTRPQEAYLKAHLPNAVNLTPTGELFSEQYGVKAASIASNSQLEAALSNAGILPTDTVIVYSGGDNPAFFLTNATRVILALKWAGVENVYFMNGGFEKWVDEKRPVQSGEVALPKTHFVIKRNTPQTYVFSDFVEWAVKNENKIQLVDVRPFAQYTGEFTSDKRLAKYGHIKGAVTLPVGECVKKVDNYFLIKTPQEIESLLKKAGVDNNKPIISYCNTGYFASGLWFVERALFNNELVFTYNGSMVSASRNPNIPIVTGASPL